MWPSLSSSNQSGTISWSITNSHPSGSVHHSFFSGISSARTNTLAAFSYVSLMLSSYSMSWWLSLSFRAITTLSFNRIPLRNLHMSFSSFSSPHPILLAADTQDGFNDNIGLPRTPEPLNWSIPAGQHLLRFLIFPLTVPAAGGESPFLSSRKFSFPPRSPSFLPRGECLSNRAAIRRFCFSFEIQIDSLCYLESHTQFVLVPLYQENPCKHPVQIFLFCLLPHTLPIITTPL